MSDIAVKKHYVEFASPGTFVSESTQKEIEGWDIAKAIEMMSGIVERYGARPYGFRFLTYGRGADDLNSREIARSHFYYVNCDILTRDEILTGTDPELRIMRLNVECNGIDRVARTRSGWLGHFPMGDKDEVIEAPALASIVEQSP